MSSVQTVDAQPAVDNSTQQTTASVSPDVQYLQGLFAVYNADPNDPSLSTAQVKLLNGVAEAERSAADLQKQLETLNTEVQERQKKGADLRDQLISAKSKSDALLRVLLDLR